MSKRILLLGLPAALVLVLLGVYALNQAAEAPVPVPEAVEASDALEATDVGGDSPPSEPASVPDPVFAATRSEGTAGVTALVAPQTATLIVEGKTLPIRSPEGATIEESMATLKAEGALDYRTRAFSGLGAFVEEIDGKASTNEYYWILHVNGKKSATGISATRIRSGDVIEWKYEKKY